ncbi:motility associated factor glycosyltransferase family protein [Candidatus Dependentiae bacterium]|nr:motility associated factor glycosyltransferase family protein [Candidatus Dependentiae bacterium]
MLNFEVIYSKSGVPVLKPVSIGNERISLHSLYDPQREADRFINQFDLSDKDVIILVGLGIGYHLKSILSAAPKKSKIIVFERFHEIYNLFESNKSILNINSDNIEILCEGNKTDITYCISKYINFRNFFKTKIITNLNSVKLDEKYYKSVVSCISDFLKFTFSNLATTGNYGYEWINNSFDNLKYLTESYDIKCIKQICCGKPAVIVSAGPSLSSSLCTLKKYRDYFYIFCVDTALSALLKENIIPDFVGTVDSQHDNYMLVRGLGNKYIKLITTIIVNPNILSEFKESDKFFFNSYSPLDNYLEHNSVLLSFIKSGGSVATSLFSAVREAECDPIIFIGQDLAFTKNNSHCISTSKIENKYSGLNKFLTNETIFFEENRNAVACRDINENYVYTSETLINFKNWFELEFADKKGNYINCTNAGILKNNIKLLDFEKAVKLYCKNIISKSDFKKNDFILSKKRLNELINNIKTELNKLEEKDGAELLLHLSKSELNEILSHTVQFDLFNFEMKKIQTHDLSENLKNNIKRLNEKLRCGF